MKKILSIFLIGILSITLIGCGESKSDDTNVNKKDENTSAKKDDKFKKYEKGKKDFLAIKDDLSVENINKVTGIEGKITKEEGDYQYYEWDYGEDFVMNITATYNKGSAYIYIYTYVSFKAPDEALANSDLNFSDIDEAQFKSDLGNDAKIGYVNDLVGGEGFPVEYDNKSDESVVYITKYRWVGSDKNFIEASVSTSDESITFASYRFNK